jgi:hypothetical protein
MPFLLLPSSPRPNKDTHLLYSRANISRLHPFLPTDSTLPKQLMPEHPPRRAQQQLFVQFAAQLRIGLGGESTSRVREVIGGKDLGVGGGGDTVGSTGG